MDILEAMEKRHAVREYTDKKLDDETKAKLQEAIDECNKEGGLNIQLFTDEPGAFDESILIYGKVKNGKNYFAMIGENAPDLEERVGYYGEKLVLTAQQLGLNTCWIGTTYKKMNKLMDLRENDRIVLVIALGYGADQGVPHKSKDISCVAKSEGDTPDWFVKGAQAALLAPTAINQQRFTFTLLDDNKVKADPGRAFFCKVDLGIAKYHFEIGAGKENFEWA